MADHVRETERKYEAPAEVELPDPGRLFDLAVDRRTRSSATRDAFREGKLGLDRYGLRERLPGLGIEYVDYKEYRTESDDG
jgi:hypothetical protein